MDSNNWRIKRDPSEPNPFAGTSNNFQRPRTDNSRGRGGVTQTGPRGAGSSGARYQQSSASSREDLRRPINGSQAEQSIEQGRRIYVGNMPYEAKSTDVENFFVAIIDSVKGINISVDPMTGRNPSYCFVDFDTEDMARHVIESYDGVDFLGRPAKIKPATIGAKNFQSKRSEPLHGAVNSSDAFVLDRWTRLEKPEDMNSASGDGRRLYVGGLPRYSSQSDFNARLRELFHGFNITVISKPISPHESRKNQPGNHYYCFVDLATVEECEAAIRQLDGLDKWNGRIKVHHTNGTSNKLHERQRLYIAGLPEFPSQETTESSVRELFEGYEITTISKLFFPKEKVEKRTGNHCFCFVEMNSGQEADRARLELDWKQMWGGEVRVKIATPNGRKADERTSRG